MRVLAGAGWGAVYAVTSTLLLVAARAARLHRSARPSPAMLRDVVLLVLGAAAEELLFRVWLVGMIGILPAAVLFAAPHAVRGQTRGQRIANVITSAVFGVLLGRLWVEHRSFGEITAFHATSNIVAGLFLGVGASDPISRRRPTETWPWALDVRADTSVAVLALSEVVPLALVLAATR